MTEWFPWYPALYEADTLHLTAAQDGIYRRLIDWYMKMRRPLPDNDQALAAIARIGLDEWLANAEVVRPFFKSRDGKLHHKRCNTELDKQDRMQKTRTEVAKKGGEARAQKLRENNDVAADGTPEAAAQHTESAPKASPKQPRSTPPAAAQLASVPATGQDKTGEEKESTPPTPQGGRELVDTVDDEFERWYAAYPLHKGRGHALKAYRSARKKADAATLLGGIKPYVDGLAAQKARDGWAPEFKHPSTWLNGQCWADDAAQPADPFEPPAFLDRRPKPNGSAESATGWTGTYLGRPTPLYEGHAAIKEHAHLTTWLKHHFWLGMWDHDWNRGVEPKTDDEARARLAALEPVIWPDETQPAKEA